MAATLGSIPNPRDEGDFVAPRNDRYHPTELIPAGAASDSCGAQIERLPPPGPSARYVIRQETSAGAHGKGSNAPLPDLPTLDPERGGLTHTGLSEACNRRPSTWVEKRRFRNGVSIGLRGRPCASFDRRLWKKPNSVLRS